MRNIGETEQYLSSIITLTNGRIGTVNNSQTIIHYYIKSFLSTPKGSRIYDKSFGTNIHINPNNLNKVDS